MIFTVSKKKYLTLSIATTFLVVLLSFNALADNFEQTISKAWDEYGFKEIDKAQKLFHDADKFAKTKQEKCEALTGLAFCMQFGKRNNTTREDYRNAIEIYDNALSLLDKSDKLRPFFLAMKAEALMQLSLLSTQKAEADDFLTRANELWKILDDGYKTDPFRQDSLLTRATLISNDFKNEKSHKAHSALKDYLKDLSKENSDEGKLLVSVMCAQLAEYSFLNENFDDVINYYKLYQEFGPTSFSMKARAYFRAARIAELKTKDKKIAIEFYRRFYNECNANEKSFFAKKKAEGLSEEKIETGVEKN